MQRPILHGSPPHMGGHHIRTSSSSLEAIVGRLETLARLLHASNGRQSTKPEEIFGEIGLMHEDLRRLGPQLEESYPDVLDKVMASMRDASAKPSLPSSLRLAIFQLVELRASRYVLPPDTTSYYSQRRLFNSMGNNTQGDDAENYAHGTQKVSFNSIPSTVAAKPYVQEIIIKNSDSGKVMGVQGKRVRLIETLTETIISFKKPQMNYRTLTIMGSTPSNITRAKKLIEDTIRRNASPSFEIDAEDNSNGFPNLTSSLDEPEFAYSIHLGEDEIHISGTQLSFVMEGKLILEDYFLQKYPHLFFHNQEEDAKDTDFSNHGTEEQRRRCYNREALIEIGKSASSSHESFPGFLKTIDPSTRDSIALTKRRSFDPVL